ncbi:MAG: hypothetical protein PUC82_01310 [bacterium]|nr:hypothetical protein [bacterium]
MEKEKKEITENLKEHENNAVPAENLKDNIEVLDLNEQKEKPEEPKVENTEKIATKSLETTTSENVDIVKKELPQSTPHDIANVKDESTNNSNMEKEVKVNNTSNEKQENKLSQNEQPIETKNASPIVNQNTTQEKKINNKPTNKKIKNIDFIIVILGILLVILVIAGYKSYLENSTVLFKTTINKGYNELSELLTDSKEKSFEYNYDEPIVINGNLKTSTNMEELISYLSYNYDFNIGLDPKTKKINLDFAMNNENEPIIDSLFYLTSDKLYIKADKIYSQVLYSDIDYNIFEKLNTEEQQSTYKDIDKLVEKMATYLKDALNDADFVKENEKIKINNHEINATKHIYKIDSNEAYRLAKSINNSIKEDQEFIEILAKITSTKKSEIEKELKEYSVDKEDYEDIEEVNLNIYTTGFFPKILGIGISTTTTNITYFEEDDRGEFNLITDKTTINAIIKDEIITGDIKEADKIVATFQVKTEENEKNSKTIIEFNMAESTTNFNITIENKELTKKQVETSININIGIEDQEDIKTIGVELKYNAEIGKEVTKIDTEVAKDMNTLTEEEQEQIFTNIQKVLEVTPLRALLTTDNSEIEETY